MTDTTDLAAVDAALAAPPAIEVAPTAADVAAETAGSLFGLRSTHGHGWISVTENGFTWTDDPRDALVVMGDGHALNIARIAFAGIAVELVPLVTLD